MFFHRKKPRDEKKKKDAMPVIGGSYVSATGSDSRTDGVSDATSSPSAPPNSNFNTLKNDLPLQGIPSDLQNDLHSPEASYAEYSFSLLKDLPKLSLPALAPVQVNQRTLVLHRNVSGDFGFNVRRTQYPDMRGHWRAVVFAEPTEVRQGPPRPSEIRNALLPGDQLLMVNGRAVDSIGREELLALIQNSGASVELTVRAMPELAELCDRNQRGARDIGDSLMLPQDTLSVSDTDIPEDERYWLMHKSGYTLVRLLETLSDGKLRIGVAGTEMIVDVTDVDKANPLSSDRIEDLSRLRYINETSAIHVLRHRLGSNLLYTNASSESIICMASEYQPYLCDKLVSLFKGCRRQQMPPHIYASAQQTYRKMQMTTRSQCIILTGVTGSGKSMQLRNLCRYLSEIAGWTQSLPYEKISAAFGVLEAFGHCATYLNKNASRFAHAFSLFFDAAASLRFARIQTFLLESSRVAIRPEKESNFHVFCYLMGGASTDIVERLRLDSIGKPVNNPLTREEDKNAAKLGWSRLMEAFATLGITGSEIQAICSVLGAILHLCYADATQSQAQRAQFVHASNAQNAASLLGVGVEQLATAVFRGSQHANTSNTMNRFAMSNRGHTGQEALHSFVACLYNELFSSIVSFLNRGLGATGFSSSTTITIIDIPGSNFNSAWCEGEVRASGLPDLVFNYVNERIAELFYDVSFTEQMELYAREQVEADMERPHLRPHYVTRLLDRKQQLLNCVNIDMRSEERRGLLCILDEEALFPGATDDSFFERIFVHFEESRIVRRGTRAREFILGHGIGSSPIVYSVDGWVKAAQPGVTETIVVSLLRTSNDAAVSSLFSPFGMSQSDSSTLRMRKATQTVRLDAAGLRSVSGYFSNISSQVDYIVSLARRASGLHFVHCVQPLATPFSMCQRSENELLDVPFVRAQLRALLIVNAARASTIGYPERLPYKDFRRRFQCLMRQDNSLTDVLDNRVAVGRILENAGVFKHRYRLGLSQVLLRSEVLAELEERRELCLSGLIEQLQHLCRRHLASKWLARRRLLETAIRCIQSNGRSYLKVREWPWWRLYTRVTPLLSAARSDEEYREWAQRVRDLEGQCAELRMTRSRLEGRVAELEQMLAAECTSAQTLSDALERETDSRVTAEKQLLLLQQRRIDESKLSSSSSSHTRLDHSTTASDSKSEEMLKEINTLRENDVVQRSRAQKATERLKDAESELQDLRARNESLEKRHSKFNSELEQVKRECQKEKEEKEKAIQEAQKTATVLDKKSAEVQSLKAENSELRMNLAKLRKELDESVEVKEGATENQLSVLRQAKRQLETKCAEQEDELDELTAKMQMMQQNLTRYEMAAERSRTERLREIDAKDSEIDEIRAQYQRRMRAFEEQLADLQDTNSSLMRQNRILESRIREVDNHSCSMEASSDHYKRDLRKALALLRDTQNVLAQERETAPNQALIRQLQEQLDDAEAAKLSALKGRHSLESELAELRTQLEEALAAKSATDDRMLVLLKEKNSALALVEEHDEQLQTLMKKYKGAVQQSALDSIKLSDLYEQVAGLEKQREKLREELNEVSSALEFRQLHSVEKHKLQLAEQKIRDLEAKLELETMQKLRLDAMMVKANDELDSLREQLSEASCLRDKEADAARKARKEMLAAKDQQNELRKRETELVHKYKQATSDLEKVETEKNKLTTELRLANKRIEALQEALNNEISDEELSDEEEPIPTQNGSFAGFSRYTFSTVSHYSSSPTAETLSPK